MLPELLLTMAVNPEADPVAAALTRVEQATAYRLILRSQGDGGEEVIRYSYRRPGFIRLDMVALPRRGDSLSPRHASGAALAARRPGRRPGMTLAPDNRLVRSARGHRVDESDVATLLRNVQRLERHGRCQRLGVVTLDGRRAEQLVVEGAADPHLGAVARYELWIDPETRFPLQVISRDDQGRRLEAVRFEALEIDPVLPADHFSP